MGRNWLTGVLTGGTVAVTLLAFGSSIWAQSGGGAEPTGRVGCVNVVQLFNEYQRQKDLTEEMAKLQEKLTAEEQQRRQKIDALQAELSALDPEDPTYVERTREMLAMQIDYKNWGDLKQADMVREVGIWSVRIYREILKVTEEIAKRDGYDLVLYRGEFQPVSMDPDVIKDQIRSQQILYVTPAIDISQAVLDKLNADYRAQPQTPMMYVP